MTPMISVLVPLQEHLCFDQFLYAMAGQQGIGFDAFEVIAVDSLYLRDWEPRIDEIRGKFPGIQISLHSIEATRSRARQLNVAFDHARADIILMLADDFIPCPELVHQHLQVHLRDSSEQVVAMGPGLFPTRARANEFMRWLEDSGELFGVCFSRPDLKLPANYFYMANTSIKRRFLARAGRFDEDFPYDAMDDWEMGIRLTALGMRNIYLPHARAYHEHIIDIEERCIAMRRAGESSAIYDEKQSRPGPWGGILKRTRVSYSQRKRESREERYQRILAAQWLAGYRSRNPLAFSRSG